MEAAANDPISIRRIGAADFSFALNDNKFSDKTLHIVTSLEPQCLQEDDNNGALQNSADNATEMAQETSSNVTVTHDGIGAKEVRTVEVRSAILAESSLFFNKLFSCGMLETEQRQATIHISPSEEQAFIYLLKFIYGGTIETQSIEELLDVLMLADKFDVPSCILECTDALDNVPMTIDSASLILCLPSSLLTTDLMRPIVKEAERFLVTHFLKERYKEEYMNLPLHIIEELLKSDELHVSSEDDIYDFAVNWANRHYHNQDVRRELFQNKLIKLIRFPQMTDYKLAEILSNEDMHCASAMKLVSDALHFKGGSFSFSKSYNSEDKRFCNRSYKKRPIRTIKLHTPKTEYRVFCDFNLGKKQSSQTFYAWGRRFFLSFTEAVYLIFCEKNERPVEYALFLRSKRSNNFCEVSRGKLTSYECNAIFYEPDYIFNDVISVQAVFSR